MGYILACALSIIEPWKSQQMQRICHQFRIVISWVLTFNLTSCFRLAEGRGFQLGRLHCSMLNRLSKTTWPIYLSVRMWFQTYYMQDTISSGTSHGIPACREDWFYGFNPSVVVIPATLLWLNTICWSWVHLYVNSSFLCGFRIVTSYLLFFVNCFVHFLWLHNSWLYWVCFNH